MNADAVLAQMTLEEKAGMCSGEDFWRTRSCERLGIPSVMMCDGPHGLRKQKGEGDHLGLSESIETISYPTASALAASFDRDVLRRLGEVLGKECQAENIAMLLGPGVNIKRSPLCGRNFEYFSEDPYLAGELAASYIESLQGQGVASCVKHYAGNNQETFRMSGDSVIDERALHEIYLPAFEAAVRKGKTRSVMCAYNAVNGAFCSENKTLLTDFLRNDCGFDGFTVTDWGAVKDRIKGLVAGLDLEMPGGNPNAAKKIIEAVQNGDLDESIVDRAVRNILKFVLESAAKQRPDTKTDLVENMEASAEHAKECAVLLKNANGLLPLKKSAKVAFIGEFAETPRYQGAGSSFINVTHPIGALEAASGLSVTYARGWDSKAGRKNTALLAKAVQTAKDSEIAVVFTGLTDAYETEGMDRETLAMPDEQNTLIEAVAAAQPNTVVVLHTGSPVDLPWLHMVPAALCVCLGGANVGTATVALLFGSANPSGRLAETWPLKLEHNPSHLNFPGRDGVVEYRESIYVGYRYYDKKGLDTLFPFGYGLSYTKFEYGGLTLSKDKIADTDTLTVTCKVKNVGNRAGKEVVQLYVRDIKSSTSRPVRELKGFVKLSLAPGEEKEASFTLNKRSFAYWETLIHDWHVESGEFVVEIGASSRDILLTAGVTVESTVELPIVFTRDTPMEKLQRMAKGREIMLSIMAQVKEKSGAAESLLESENAGMIQAMMQEMPLGAMASYGLMSEEQLNGMLAVLNS
jgi:beta-glucosidase